MIRSATLSEIELVKQTAGAAVMQMRIERVSRSLLPRISAASWR